MKHKRYGRETLDMSQEKDEPIEEIGYGIKSVGSADIDIRRELIGTAEKELDSAGKDCEKSIEVSVKMDDSSIKNDEKEMSVQDPLLEIDLGLEKAKCPIFISAKLSPKQQGELRKLLIKYKDCFAWSYEEMPGLSRRILEHRLPIKKGFKPYKRPACRFEPSIVFQIKNEIDNLLKAGFIRSA